MSNPTAGDAAVAAGVEVAEAHEVDLELIRAWERLTPQLSSSSAPPTETELLNIVSSRSTVMFIARDARSDDAELVGSLTLALFRIPTGLRAWIEDVVVDESARWAAEADLRRHTDFIRGIPVALTVLRLRHSGSCGRLSFCCCILSSVTAHDRDGVTFNSGSEDSGE